MPSGSLLHFGLLKDAILRRCLLVTAVFLGLLMSLSAWAKDDSRFVLHNSSDFVIVSFQIQEADESFSPVWLPSERVMPGDTFDMEFSGEGRCEVRVRMVSHDRYVRDYLMDFCRSREIFIEDNRISYR